MKILVTGGTGFIGHHLLARLCLEGYDIRATARKSSDRLPCPTIHLPGLHALTEWKAALKDVEIVIHLAGQAHGRKTGIPYPDSCRVINFEGTRRLAEQAAATGVRRLIFLSFIGVLGEKTECGKAFCPSDQANPYSNYTLSKWHAEQSLLMISKKTPLEVTILRAPMVYGPGNPGNPLKVLRWVDRQWPIPLQALESNERSFVGISNLVDFILLCLNHRSAAHQILHISDDEDLSTAEFFRKFGKATGIRLRQAPIPLSILKTGLRLLGKGAWINKICENLKVDIQKTKQSLGWAPIMRVDEELEQTARWWRGTAEKT